MGEPRPLGGQGGWGEPRLETGGPQWHGIPESPLPRECRDGAKVAMPGAAGLAASSGRGWVLLASLALPWSRWSPLGHPSPGRDTGPPQCPPRAPSVEHEATRARLPELPRYPGAPGRSSRHPQLGGGTPQTGGTGKHAASPPGAADPMCPRGPPGSPPVPGTCGSEQGSGAAEQAERAPGHPARCRCRSRRLYPSRGRRERPRPRRPLSVPGGTAAPGGPPKTPPTHDPVSPAHLPP